MRTHRSCATDRDRFGDRRFRRRRVSPVTRPAGWGRGVTAVAVLAVVVLAGPAALAQSHWSQAPLGTINIDAEQSARAMMEALIGRDDMVRLSDYPDTHPGRALSRPVGRLDIEMPRASRLNHCTAFIVSTDYIVTNAHCIPGVPSDVARFGAVAEAVLTMDYYDEVGTRIVRQYAVDPQPVETDRALDYSVLRVRGNPAARFGRLALPPARPAPAEPMVLFHHPFGMPKMLSARDCEAADPPIDVDGQLVHYCDTFGGSSGAPLLDANGTHWLGLHSAGIPGRFNLAIPAQAIVRDSTVLAQLFPDQTTRPPVERETPPSRPSRRQPGEVFRDCPECPELVVVPAGSFTMGSPEDEEGRNDDEGPQRRVRIGYDFAVGRYEVTVGQYAEFVAATGHGMSDTCWTYETNGWGQRTVRTWRRPGYAQTDDHPVVCVSSRDAQAYVGWLSGETGEEYRLLSESEWEYAARAGTTTRFGFGDEITEGQANFNFSIGRTTEVGSYQPNAWGLYDMHGNVWEWVEDCWNDGYEGAPTDGSAWLQGVCNRRVVRGGSWDSLPEILRSAVRSRSNPGGRGGNLGFRVTRMLTP